MRRADIAALVFSSSALLASASAPAATGNRTFAIPPTTLDAALALFATQGGADVGVTGASIGRDRSRGVRGRMLPSLALDRLLAGTSWRAVAVPRGGFRLERRPAPRLTLNWPTAPGPDTTSPKSDIVVKANKYGSLLLRFPGSVSILDIGQGDARGRGQQSLAEAMKTPAVQSTALGAGRDKVFVRGIADSSFLGPSQSTTGIYFGDVQLANNGPDPSLVLYDVDRIEVLEGPQGTLYGSGAIGGVIRIVPRAPEFDQTASALSAGVSATWGGEPGAEVAGMINLPLVGDTAAIRLVAYHSREGGYVDDALRGLHDINLTHTAGGRGALRIASHDGWTVDASGIVQSIDTRDSQYGLRDLPGISRRSVLSQPFEDDFTLGRLIVTKVWDSGVTLVSASGAVRSVADDRFDASLGNFPLVYDTHNRNRQLTQEVRLTRRHGGSGWVLGGSLLRDRDIITREFGVPKAERSMVGVTNRTFSEAIFGEATVAVMPTLALTGGARISHARTDSLPSTMRGGGPFLRGRSQTRLDPTVAASWLLASHLALYGRYEQGYRTGGLSVAAGVGRVADFDSDTIGVIETGLRMMRSGDLGVTWSVAYSRAKWNRIQADLITARGFPFTANVGNAKIDGLEVNADWVPVERLHLVGGTLISDNRNFDRKDLPPGIRATRLPDTPRVSLTGGINIAMPFGGGELRLGGDVRYVGTSYLDPVAFLNIRQGGYAAGNAMASLRRGPLRLDVTVDNIANTRGDRFALGNPFGVARGNQYTPLRPRTLRVTLSWER
jgi:outer membrane receptor protein involved in Fe transport